MSGVDGVSGVDGSDTLDAHPGGHVVSREAVWQSARDERAPSIARRWLAATLDDWAVDLAPATRHDLVLAVSELVTNAVMHTSTATIAVTLRHTTSARGGRVTVEVHDDADDSDGQVAIVDPGLAPGRLGGQGLRVVDQVADRWGCRSTETGKVVWLEVDTTTPRADTPR